MEGQLFGQLDVTVLRGTRLRDTQTFGKQDPYVKLTVANHEFKTKTHTDGGVHPQWNEKVTFQLQGANLMNEELKLTVMNENTLTGDATIGATSVPLRKVILEGVDQIAPQLQYKNKTAGSIEVGLRWTSAGADDYRNAHAPARPQQPAMGGPAHGVPAPAPAVPRPSPQVPPAHPSAYPQPGQHQHSAYPPSNPAPYQQYPAAQPFAQPYPPAQYPPTQPYPPANAPYGNPSAPPQQPWVRDRREEARRAFQRFDKDGNGHICTREFLLCLHHLGHTEILEANACAIFGVVDTSGDGKISQEEFLECYLANF